MNPKIAKLIKTYQETNQEDILMTLWEDFQPLVLNLMKKFYIPWEQRDDTSQEAFIQLLTCANSYDPGKGIAFEAYYKTTLTYWFLNLRHKKTDLLLVDHGWESGQSLTNLMESTLANVEESAEINENCQALEEAFKKLTKKQQEVVSLFYLKGSSLMDIAKEMGCSYKVAFKHKDAGLKKLRKQMII